MNVKTTALRKAIDKIVVEIIQLPRGKTVDSAWYTDEIMAKVQTVQAEAEQNLLKLDLNWQIGDLTIHYLPKHILEAALNQKGASDV